MTTDEQLSIILANAEHTVGIEEIKAKLNKGKKLNIKLGVDPTRPDLTFGHWVVFNKLRQLQELGHHIIFLIGDYTTLIGDPSGRSSTRPILTKEQIDENSKTYLDQAFKVLDKKFTEVRHNSEWFCNMNFGDLLSLSRNVTVAQLLERDDFTKRYKSNTPIALVEFLYPILQAYDSVKLKSDIELGGMDQLFNLCLGRQFQKIFGQNEQAALCMPLLVGLDGVKKMSKSLGNYIAFNDNALDMYGKIMSIPDETMWNYFKLLLLEKPEKIIERKKQHPMLMKKELAHIILTKFFDKSSADREQTNFETIFSKKETPNDLKIFDKKLFNDVCKTLLDVICATKMYQGSKKDLKRLIEQGGLEVNNKIVKNPFEIFDPQKDEIFKVGKRLFFKIKK